MITDPLHLGVARAKELLITAGISPTSDPDFPFRFLRTALPREEAFTYADLFNRGNLPDPLQIKEQRLRQLVSALRTHYLYGRFKRRIPD